MLGLSPVYRIWVEAIRVRSIATPSPHPEPTMNQPVVLRDLAELAQYRGQFVSEPEALEIGFSH